MYFRISTKKREGKSFKFVQLARSVRVGKRIRTEIIAHLGPYDRFIEKEAPGLLARLSQMTGQTIEETIFEDGQDIGNSLAMILLWEKIGLTAIFRQQVAQTKVSFDIIKYIQCLIINRLCDPTSKLGIGEWLRGTYLPGFSQKEFIYHHALRSMDWLIKHKSILEKQIAEMFLTLFDETLQILFYDVTSSYFTSDRSIEVEDPNELRRHGYSRDKRPECYQITLGLVMTKEGLPLCHYVFAGNTVDRSTVCEVIEDVKKRFGINDVIIVGDKGMLSGKNLDMITEEELKFIISHPLRGDNAVCHVINKTLSSLKKMAEHTDGGVYSETNYQGRRFVVSYSKQRAEETKDKRIARLEKAEVFVEEKLSSLKRSSDGRMRKSRGRPLTPQGSYDAIHDYLRDHKLLSLFKVRLEGNKVVVSANEQVRAWEDRIDGIVVVETTEPRLSPSEVIKQYRNLKDIEKGFRTLKSSLDLRPMYHWTQKRIRAHVFICVIALQLSHVMHRRLSNLTLSWEKAIERLRGIKTFTIRTGSVVRRGITTADSHQKDICRQMEIPFPQYRHLAPRE